MYKKYFLRLFLLVFALLEIQAQQKDSSFYDIGHDTLVSNNYRLDIPIHDLLNTMVQVASKKEEKISDAPSSITAYSSTDIEQLGYYTLADLAGITSGYSVNYLYGETGFETRGQRANAFENNKHLLLIDGIPVNFARSFKAQIQEELPLFFAQRVEFLKGPASALYGTSAFHGVVNILSKSPLENGTMSETKVSGGNWNNNFRLMSNMAHRSNSGTTSLNIGYFYKNPSGALVMDTAFENTRYWDKNVSFFLRASHMFSGGLKGLSTGLIFLQRTGGIGEGWIKGASSETNNIVWRTLVPYVKYQKTITPKTTWNSYLKANNSMEEANFLSHDSLRAMGFYKSNVVNVEVLSELQYAWNPRNSIVFGLNYDRRKELGNPTSYSYSLHGTNTLNDTSTALLDAAFYNPSVAFNMVSSYAQYQKKIGFLSGLSVTGGLRFDLGIMDIFHYSQLSPRIAVVQKITPKLILKVMTGKALRVPTIKEIGVSNQILEAYQIRNIAPPKFIQLSPEATQTYESGLTYSSKRIRTSAVVFYTESSRLIQQSSDENSTEVSVASGDWKQNGPNISMVSKGLEVDLAFALSKTLNVFSNYTYVLAKNYEGIYLSEIPATRINGGLLCALTGKYKFKGSATVSHIDGYQVQSPVKRLTHSSTFVDVNLIFPLTETLHTEFQVRNVLNNEVYYPSGIPLRGRTFQVTLAVKIE